jgi:TctA family transporter
LLLPATYALPPLTALILLAGVYCAAVNGGSTRAILVNPQGESPPVQTGMDGYLMAGQGRAGPALAAAGLGAFFAGSIGTLVLAAFAPALAQRALQFGPVESFSLLVLGMTGAAVLAAGSLIKGMAMGVLGLLLGLVGTEVDSGLARFAFDIPELGDGIGFVVIALGVFGYGEIISNLARPESVRAAINVKVPKLLPTWQDTRSMVSAMLRGTALGSLLGMLPGGGTAPAAMAAHALEHKFNSRPGEVPLGEGNIRGVVAPESAHNAGAQTVFIPMLALGIPPNAVMALMLGAMGLHHIQPGPQVLTSMPELFWGLIASLCLGNLMRLALNLPLMGLWIRLLNVPYRWLFPAIVLFCSLGVYAATRSAFDVWLVAAFGFVGYVFHKLDIEPAPLLLGFVLGPMMEKHLHAALLLSRGDWSVFVMRPLSAGLLLAALCTLVLVLLPALQPRRA